MAKKGNNTEKSKLQPAEYEKLILEQVKQNPSGLTIADISKKLEISRITVSKYILVLEAKKKVLSKSIGAYTLFLPVKKTIIPLRSASTYMQGLLSGLAIEIPENQEEVFKRIGLNMHKYFNIPLGSEFPRELIKPEKGSYRNLLEYYGENYETWDLIFGGSIDIEVDVDKEGTKASYLFKDISLLDESEDFILYFYLISGMIERTLGDLINKKVFCRVENISNNNVELSIQIS